MSQKKDLSFDEILKYLQKKCDTLRQKNQLLDEELKKRNLK